jgi:hypothetical protein
VADAAVMITLSVIPVDHAATTETTMDNPLYFLDYVASHPDEISSNRASDMILVVHSNASYITEPKVRIQAGGAVKTISNIIPNVMTSAADAEIGSLFVNICQVVPVRYLLKEMGHPQLPTPLQTDNMTALCFVTNNLQPKTTKLTGMNY